MDGRSDIISLVLEWTVLAIVICVIFSSSSSLFASILSIFFL